MNTRPVAIVDPRTGNFVLAGQPRRQPGALPMGPAPITRNVRARFRGFGDVPPNQSGGQGALIAPYDENGLFNPSRGSGGGPAPVVNSSNEPTPNPAQTGFLPGSAPWGESDRPWSNPTTFATVPINAATSIAVPVLSQNFARNFLLIQNGSTATVAGDVAPIMYIGFNSQPIVGSSLALAPGVTGGPGVGIPFDTICPRDSIYVAFGPFVNTGGSVIIRGAVIQGTYAPS